MISCINYQNHTNIKRLFMVLKSFDYSFSILGGGNLYGSDSFIKSMCLKLGYNFIEYIPTHFEHTPYSYFPKKFHKGKFSVNNFNQRYQYLYFDSELILIFRDSNRKDVAIDKFIEYSNSAVSQKDKFIIN